ncbi:hypothetical protein C8035_v007588 [Colletotrichum spinosum]|uniref:Uncharacterized protein n=1 Tax=Colletotrichum spinosum TaxID=1347390 RepID=A0A4R8PS08_9PEZI|nr:hypothetical protein C8035_v007588 [Colletotrichum spinosum]
MPMDGDYGQNHTLGGSVESCGLNCAKNTSATAVSTIFFLTDTPSNMTITTVSSATAFNITTGLAIVTEGMDAPVKESCAPGIICIGPTTAASVDSGFLSLIIATPVPFSDGSTLDTVAPSTTISDGGSNLDTALPSTVVFDNGPIPVTVTPSVAPSHSPDDRDSVSHRTTSGIPEYTAQAQAQSVSSTGVAGRNRARSWLPITFETLPTSTSTPCGGFPSFTTTYFTQD